MPAGPVPARQQVGYIGLRCNGPACASTCMRALHATEVYAACCVGWKHAWRRRADCQCCLEAGRLIIAPCCDMMLSEMGLSSGMASLS